MIALILNTNPVLRRALPDLTAISAQLGDTGRVFESPSLEALPHVAQAIADAAPDYLAIWGGDGTIHATLSAVTTAYAGRPLPTLCLLPAGTINTAARCIGMKGKAGRCLTRLVAAVRDGVEMTTHRRTTIRMGEQVGFLFGVGLIPNLLRGYNEAEKGGKWQSLKLFLSATKTVGVGGYDRFFDPFHARITVNGRVWHEGTWTNVSGGGIKCLPYGLNAYIRAAEVEGKFHFIAHALNSRRTFTQLVRLQSGKGMKGVEDDVLDEVIIETETPQEYNFDGDNFPARTRFHLHAGPVVELVVPPKPKSNSPLGRARP